jgi:hypothetical protein
MRRYNVPKARDRDKQVPIVKYRRRKKRTAKSIPALSGVNAESTNSGLLTDAMYYRTPEGKRIMRTVSMRITRSRNNV